MSRTWTTLPLTNPPWYPSPLTLCFHAKACQGNPFVSTLTQVLISSTETNDGRSCHVLSSSLLFPILPCLFLFHLFSLFLHLTTPNSLRMEAGYTRKTNLMILWWRLWVTWYHGPRDWIHLCGQSVNQSCSCNEASIQFWT